jgi:hypothetical protein
MTKGIKVVAGIMSALCLAVTVAEAGHKVDTEVSVFHFPNYSRANGAVGSARASADGDQFIGCALQADEATIHVSCSARSAPGKRFWCTSYAASIIQAAASIGPSSYLHIVADAGGKCTGLWVNNSSEYRPMVP